MAEQETPKHEYPLLYVFRVVAKHHPDVKERVKRLVELELGPLPDEAVTERESRAGNFRAVHVSCLLTSEEQRRAVYMRFKTADWIVLSL